MEGETFRCESCDSVFDGAYERWLEIEALEYRFGDTDTQAVMAKSGDIPKMVCPACLVKNEG
jgi:transposase-like protein